MRLTIGFTSQKPVTLQLGYNHQLQGVIYNFLDRIGAEMLHNQGFAFEKRSFKLFVFSDILERCRYDRELKEFTFPPEISFILSSPVDWIIEQTARNLIQSEVVHLGHNELQISSLELTRVLKITERSSIVRALTPIEIHSTLQKPDGKKITHYLKRCGRPGN